ncbi:hypothetical protein [Pedobacter jamesrossensis]|uniref:Uncharacterized protein n=1 Tax=Pedobacter jamesrossensis TaxID=1908238 RepID=A0ABV8NPY9_9SPHI
MKLDMQGTRDKNQNFMVNQYHDPAYGFDLKAVLDRYEFKELADPKTREALETAMKNGDKAAVTVEKDGAKVTLNIEAVPRYSQVNFFTLDGKAEKREQFLKETALDKAVSVSKDKEKAETQSQGMGL